MTAPRSRPKDRKATIVTAAAELFADRGFATVGIDEIGARVGVTGPAIYRHFPNKEALLVAVLEQMLEGFVENVEESARMSGGDLAAVVSASVQHILDHSAYSVTYLRERRSPVVGVPASRVRSAERRIRRGWLAVERTVLPDIDPLRGRLRQYAIVGAVAAAARDHKNVARPRLDELLIASAIAVASFPMVVQSAESKQAKRTKQRWQAGPSKQEEILSAALRLFRERGVNGVGIDEVGAAAGISGPTIYHYFESKSAIVLEAYDRAGERVAVGTHEALRSATSAEDALDRLIASYVAVAADNVDLIVVTSRESDCLPEFELARLSRRRRTIRDGWAAALGQIRPDLTEPETRLLVRTVFPLVNQAVEAAEGQDGLRPEIVALAGAHFRSK